MYINSAYLNNSLVDFMDKSKPLIVGSCGTYHLYTNPRLPTYRPKGRLDFQILYVASGKAHFYFNDDGTDTVVPDRWSTARKSLRNMNILASTRRRSTGFILQEVISKICCAVTASQMRCMSSTLELRWNTRVFSNR